MAIVMLWLLLIVERELRLKPGRSVNRARQNQAQLQGPNGNPKTIRPPSWTWQCRCLVSQKSWKVEVAECIGMMGMEVEILDAVGLFSSQELFSQRYDTPMQYGANSYNLTYIRK